MHAFSVTDLAAVRENRVLRDAARLCRMINISERTWQSAAGIVALNLRLHGRADLGDRVLGLSLGTLTERNDLASTLEQLMLVRTKPSQALPGSDIRIDSLAGWQHREFFSALVPLYAEIGIAGAREMLDGIRGDTDKHAAMLELARRYQDEHLMALMPLEL